MEAYLNTVLGFALTTIASVFAYLVYKLDKRLEKGDKRFDAIEEALDEIKLLVVVTSKERELCESNAETKYVKKEDLAPAIDGKIDKHEVMFHPKAAGTS